MVMSLLFTDFPAFRKKIKVLNLSCKTIDDLTNTHLSSLRSGQTLSRSLPSNHRNLLVPWRYITFFPPQGLWICWPQSLEGPLSCTVLATHPPYLYTSCFLRKASRLQQQSYVHVLSLWLPIRFLFFHLNS